PCMSEDTLINALTFLRSTTDFEQAAGVLTCWAGRASVALVKSSVAIMVAAKGMRYPTVDSRWADECQLSDLLARIIRDVVRFGGPRFSVPACM
ncbi:MAG: hypothetical protein ACLGIM_20365, partial [Alphaproteobacteria bacterium]